MKLTEIHGFEKDLEADVLEGVRSFKYPGDDGYDKVNKCGEGPNAPYPTCRERIDDANYDLLVTRLAPEEEVDKANTEVTLEPMG